MVDKIKDTIEYDKIRNKRYKGYKTILKEIEKRLDKADIKYYNDDSENGINIKIPNDNGYIRIYKDLYGFIVVQNYHREKMEYSGIPTFF